LGSTEPHYTPSKVFQAMLSRRPLFALLHEASTAVGMIRASRAGEVLTLSEGRLPEPRTVADGLRVLMTGSFDAAAVDRSGFSEYTARESTRLLAAALDQAMSRQERPAGRG
jgi:hypothetical protein